MTKRSRITAHNICLMLLVQIVMVEILLAQQNGLPGPPSIKDPKSQTRDRQDREATLRSAELGTAVSKIDQKRMDATLDQMKQDFRRIQIVRNEMVRNLLANKPFDYKLISDEVAEINTRADRLKNSLMPSVSTEKVKVDKAQEELSPEELKNALIKLCNSIDSFVESPVLKNPATTDVKELSSASADLLKVIELSGRIRKTALRLNNNPR